MLMENWYRAFAYSMFIMVIGLAIVVFTEEFIRFIQAPGWQGYTAAFGYGLVYLNFAFVMTKRYTTKVQHQEHIAYMLAALLLVGPLIWVFLKDLNLTSAGRFYFLSDIAFGCLIGAWFGIKRGAVKHQRYLELMKEYEKENDLDRPHDDLSRN